MVHWRCAFVTVTLAIVVVSAGCLDSGVTRCSDGWICPSGEACDPVVGGCVSLTPCVGHPDSDPCRALGIPVGACNGGQCVATPCGDGILGGVETCDDGNHLSHDGCSSGCQLEIPTWTMVTPTQPPSARAGAAMVYDAGRGRVTLFGGADTSGGTVGDTWEWNGAWIERTPGVAPPGRWGAAMAYDALRGQTVLFGGIGATSGPTPTFTDYNDTWEWDGNAWTQRSPATSPPARGWAAVTFDPTRGRIILFGGLDSMGTTYGDTWEWDGTTWTDRTPVSPPAPPSPSPRDHIAMVHDAARGRIVLFGGGIDSTWEWDGTSWEQRTPAHVPRSNGFAAVFYDAARARVVVFGGAEVFVVFDETWEWDGNDWARLGVPSAPPPRAAMQAIAYDAVRGRAVLFGGDSGNGSAGYLGDTWEFRYDSATPDETCVAGVDADGDGLVGCADPDCWGSCAPSCPPGTTCDQTAARCGDGVCNPDLESAVCTLDCP